MPQQTVYRIDGLAGWSDADAVAARLSALPLVQNVKMDIVAGTAVVTSAEPLAEEAVRGAVADAGRSLASSTPQSRQTTPISLGMFVCGLVVALIAGFTLSRVTGPGVDAHATPANDTVSAGTHQHGSSGEISGLSISSGYTLVSGTTSFAGPGSHQLSFVIKDANGQVTTAFATIHTKPMHLVVVRRDLSGYQHLHPQMSTDGVWTVTADLREPGPWRAYADFTAIDSSYAQAALTLGFDLLVAGDFQPRPLPGMSRKSIVDSQAVGYRGDVAVGTAVPLLFQVTERGRAAELEPHLGALGHLVVLREGDLGYLHVHPEPQQSGTSARFWLTVPGPGRYRMYFDYRTHGKVRTAEFTLVVT